MSRSGSAPLSRNSPASGCTRQWGWQEGWASRLGRRAALVVSANSQKAGDISTRGRGAAAAGMSRPHWALTGPVCAQASAQSLSIIAHDKISHLATAFAAVLSNWQPVVSTPTSVLSGKWLQKRRACPAHARRMPAHDPNPAWCVDMGRGTSPQPLRRSGAACVAAVPKEQSSMPRCAAPRCGSSILVVRKVH